MSKEAEIRAGMRDEAPPKNTSVTGYDAWPLNEGMRADAMLRDNRRLFMASVLRQFIAEGRRSCAYRDLRGPASLSDIHHLSWLGVLRNAKTTSDIPYLMFTPFTKSWAELVLAEASA